jgi:hypothetical protein
VPHHWLRVYPPSALGTRQKPKPSREGDLERDTDPEVGETIKFRGKLVEVVAVGHPPSPPPPPWHNEPPPPPPPPKYKTLVIATERSDDDS